MKSIVHFINNPICVREKKTVIHSVTEYNNIILPQRI